MLRFTQKNKSIKFDAEVGDLVLPGTRPRNVQVRRQGARPYTSVPPDASATPAASPAPPPTRPPSSLIVPSRRSSISLPSRPVSNVEPLPSLHPFDATGFKRGLVAAGYVEPLDTSRRKVKSRFVHALTKEKFKPYLDQFLDAKNVKARGEFMVRFVGLQDVHSPFVHLYTTSIPLDVLPVRVHAESFDDKDRFTLWTYLRTVKGASHWSCKAKGFWPLRVVLEGPEGVDTVPQLTLPPRPSLDNEEDDANSDSDGSRDDSPHNPVPALTITQPDASSSRAPSPRPQRIRVSVDSPPDSPPPRSPSPPPTPKPKPPPPRRTFTLGGSAIDGDAPSVLAAVKQLGESVAKAIPPGLQRVQTSLDALWTSWAVPKLTEEEQEQAEREERRRARRERREARRLEEEEEEAFRRARREEKGKGREVREEREETKEERRERRAMKRSATLY